MSLPRLAQLLLVGLAVLGSAPSRAVEPPGRLSFRSYGTDAGIENHDMSQILQDGEQFIWVCAPDAVYRFDGERFERFGQEAGLPSTVVSDMTLDAEGRLVLVTHKGVVRWEGSRFAPVPLQGIASDVWKLRLDPRTKRLWAGTGEGLFHEEHPGHFVLEAGWPGGPVHQLWADASGALQVTSGARLLSRDPKGHWSTFKVAGGPASITALARDGQGRLWLGAEHWLGVQPRPGAQVENRTALLQGLTGAGGRLRVGRRGQILIPNYRGLLEVEGEQSRQVRLSLSERAARMRDVLEDPDGTLWVSSMGVHRSLGRGLWRIHDSATGLPSSMVWGLARGPDGRLWVGTDKGLVYGTAEGWAAVPGLEDYCIKAVLVDGEGAVWAAGNPSGMHRYEPWSGRLQTFGEESGFSARYTFQMVMEPDGSLWAATTGGVLRGERKGDTWAFGVGLSLGPRASGMGVARDASGRLWATGNGLHVREDGVFRRLGKAEGLRDERVRYVLPRRDGRVCVSYAEPLGISCFTYRDGQLREPFHLDRQSGLYNNVVYVMGEDTAGRLWVGTGAGVHVVGRDGVIEHFGVSSGAPGDDFSGNSFLVEPEGTVWLGTSNGLGRFDGARYSGPAAPPRVYLLDVLLGASSYPRPPREPLQAPHAESTLVVRFADLGLVSDGGMEHQVRMVGVDEWHTVPGHLVRYSRLPPGHFRFEIRGREGRGEWGPVAGFDLAVHPPWWASWWARGLSVLLIAGAVAGVVRWRSLALRRRNAELERLVEARTAELARAREKVAQAEKLSAMGQLMARLSHEINNPLTAIHSNLPPVREYFEQLAEALRRCRERLEAHPEDLAEVERVWRELELDFVLEDTPEALEAMRLATERIRSIQADLRAFLRGERPRLEDGDINQTAHETVELVRRSLPAGARVELHCGQVPRFCFHPGQMGQVLLNLVRNALDAVGEQGEVRVTTGLREGQVELTVADDGPGIPPEMHERIFEPFFTTKDMGKGSGLGLAICRQLVTENHGGTLELDTSVPRGACFRVRLPLVEVEQRKAA